MQVNELSAISEASYSESASNVSESFSVDHVSEPDPNLVKRSGGQSLDISAGIKELGLESAMSKIERSRANSYDIF